MYKFFIAFFPYSFVFADELFLKKKSHVPFAVVGSSDTIKIGNKSVRARQYPWGVVISI
jgi:septin 6/8/11